MGNRERSEQGRGLIRYQMIFRGRVQGVGFRYTAYYSASHYGLTGWVRNEYDGSVHAQIQGRQEEIDAWEKSLGEARYIVIETVDRKEIAVVGEERDFRILD